MRTNIPQRPPAETIKTKAPFTPPQGMGPRPLGNAHEGQLLVVVLPSEHIRARVDKVVSPTEIEAVLDVQVPMSKTHHYKAGDRVKCILTKGILGDSWEAVG